MAGLADRMASLAVAEDTMQQQQKPPTTQAPSTASASTTSPAVHNTDSAVEDEDAVGGGVDDDFLDFLTSLPSSSSASASASSTATASTTEAKDKEGEQQAEPEVVGPKFDGKYSTSFFDNKYTRVLRSLTPETFDLLKSHGYVVSNLVLSVVGEAFCLYFASAEYVCVLCVVRISYPIKLIL